MAKYIIVVGENYVRDTQIAYDTKNLTDDEFYDELYDNCGFESCWSDFEGSIFLGVVEANTAQEALKQYVEKSNPWRDWDPRTLEAIDIACVSF